MIEVVPSFPEWLGATNGYHSPNLRLANSRSDLSRLAILTSPKSFRPTDFSARKKTAVHLQSATEMLKSAYKPTKRYRKASTGRLQKRKWWFSHVQELKLFEKTAELLSMIFGGWADGSEGHSRDDHDHPWS